MSLLPRTVPHASLIAQGEDAGGEWMILRRIQAQTWTHAWPALTQEHRRRLTHELAHAIAALHAVQPPAGFSNPWLEQALAGDHRLHEAHHPPVEAIPRLLQRLRSQGRGDPALLEALAARAAALDDACRPDDPRVLVHADLHWDNLLVRDGHLVAILDWEGARLGRSEQELDTILRYATWPWIGVAAADVALCRAEAYRQIPGWLRQAEPCLFEEPRLKDRLALHAVAHDLLQGLHFPPEDPPAEGAVWWRLRRLAEGAYPWPRLVPP